MVVNNEVKLEVKQFLSDLLEVGDFYPSAIEINTYHKTLNLDGIEIENKIIKLLKLL